MVYFQSGDFPNAVGELKKAYQLKRIPGLLFNIGQTYRKMDDIDMAIFYFEKFLKDAPATAPNRGEAEKILSDLKAKKATGAPVTVPPPLDTAETPAPSAPPATQAPTPAPRHRRTVDKFEHKEIEEAPPQTPLDVRIQLPEQEGLRATLYYRAAGQETYTPVAMHQRYDEWVGRIAGEMILGKSFQYYIEARDASGQVIGKSGSASGPNIVSIVDGAKPQFYADLTEGPSGGEAAPTEAPTIAKKKGKRRRRRAEEEEEDEDEPRTLRNFRTLKWTSAGVAAATLLMGLSFELLASSHSSDVEKQACMPPDCSSPSSFFGNDLQSTQSSGQTFSTLGTVSLLVGVAAAGAAVTFFLLDDSSEIERENNPRRRRSTLSLAPVVVPSQNGGSPSYGLGGGFRF
jgi:hypothetical protein